MKFIVSALVALCAQAVYGDFYMHNPRGSNNRLNEANVNRNNANRLFDSQNNGKGGYCEGPRMNYYAGSQLEVEWTAQHACGLATKTDCVIVFQYMCGSESDEITARVRDGIDNTNRVQANDNANNGAGDETLGLHESLESYQLGANTQRNKGLYIADRNLNGDTARFTRQNNGGNRNGLEIAEERDYYPYWRASQWIDAAILTSDTTLCPYFQAESYNVKDRYVCVGSDQNNEAPISQEACAAENGQWEVVKSHFGDIPETEMSLAEKTPDCMQAPFSRDNHLGNGIGGNANTYTFSFPDAAKVGCVNQGDCRCVMRGRYNISTHDYNGWGTYDPATKQLTGYLDYQYDGDNSPLKQDPLVASDTRINGPDNNNNEVQLAANTDQLGRVFQDRSFTFSISSVPPELQGVEIYNMNVRGKRGNIVQTYPSVEYDFAGPETIPSGAAIHYQWTGCDTNPAGNAGEGTDQTDRSNIVELNSLAENLPYNKINTYAVGGFVEQTERLFNDPADANLAAHLGQTNCKSVADLLSANGNNQNDANQDEQNCAILNAPGANYLNMDPIVYTEPKTYNFMSTRNNNFSNRSQKNSLTVTKGALPTWGVALAAVGAVVVVTALAVVGLFAFARTHPHSAVASMFSRS